MNRRFGWRPDKEDTRDWLLPRATIEQVAALPAEVILRQYCGPVLDQSRTSSCTAHTTVECDFFVQKRMGVAVPVQGSVLFNYYDGRERDNVDFQESGIQDAGLTIRNSVKSWAKAGVSPSREWPWKTRNVNKKPPPRAYTLAEKHQALVYWRVQPDVNQVKIAISQGWGIEIGVMMYSSAFTSQVDRTGVIPMPGPGDSLEGGHAMFLCGYERGDWGIVQNHWSLAWGDAGFGRIPLRYLAEQGGDFWTVRLVER